MKRAAFRLRIYVVILAGTLCALGLAYLSFDLHHGDLDNTRYLLSALSQSQAAIMAIVVSVSLVAIELASSSYSPRLIDVLKSNPDLYALVLLYGISIAYDFVLLEQLNINTSEFHILVSYWLSAAAFLALFPYVHSMINMLSPKAIIRRVLENIDSPDEFENQRRSKQQDPFLPIVDIVRGAFTKHDCETIRTALIGMAAKAMGVRYEIADGYIGSYRAILGSGFTGGRFIPDKSKWKPSKELSKNYAEHMSQIGRLFADSDEVLAVETILNLKAVAEVVTEKRLGAEDDIAQALGSIGIISVQRGFRKATNSVINTLRTIGESIPYEPYTMTWGDGSRYAYPYGNIMESIIGALDELSVLAINKWGVYELQYAGKNVEKVGMTVVSKGLTNQWRALAIVSTFRTLGTIVVNRHRNPTAIMDFIVYDNVVRPLDSIGKTAYERGIVSSEKGVASAFSEAIAGLCDVGMDASVGGFVRTASESAKALAELALLDEEAVGQALDGATHLRSWNGKEFAVQQEFIETYRTHLTQLKTPGNEEHGNSRDANPIS